MVNNISDIIRKVLCETRCIFLNHPAVFLTETDVICCIVAKLLKNPELSGLEWTLDNTKSVPVHTEVRWYGRNGNLNMRSDIVVLKPADLTTVNGCIKLPSKGYGFDKAIVAIEVKLRRSNQESNDKFIKRIKKDIDKLTAIHRDVGNFPLYLYILDKYSLPEPPITSRNDPVDIQYISLKDSRQITRIPSRSNIIYPYDRILTLNLQLKTSPHSQIRHKGLFEK